MDPHLGLEVSAGGVLEADEEASGGEDGPSPTVALFPALRMRPFPDSASFVAGLWLAAGAGLAYDREGAHPLIDLRAGIDVPLGPYRMGPFIGFWHLPSSDEVDAHDERVSLLAGLHAAFDAGPVAATAPASRTRPAARAEPVPPAPGTFLETDDRPESFAPRGPETDAPPPPRSAAEAPARAEPDGPVTRVRLDEAVHFPINSARIGMSAAAALRRAVAPLHTEAVVRIFIEGHSDATGSAAYNQALSLARAKSAQDILLELGIPSEIVVVEALAASHPVAPQSDVGALARNRRVEIVVELRAPASAPSSADAAASSARTPSP